MRATLSVAYFWHVFHSQVFYCKRYGFEWAVFTHKSFLHCTLFPYSGASVTETREVTPTLGTSSMPALIELSLRARAWS